VPQTDATGNVHQVVVARTRVGRVLWMGAGFACVGVGVVGIILPGLPTTPFMLLAAACFYRSSQRFYDWLIHNPRFGHYLRDYREGKGIPRRVKWLAIGVMIPFVAYAVTWGIPPRLMWARVVTLLAGIGGLVFVLTRPTSRGSGEIVN
jgi:uncharacterized membrane protein YbaN (DUF454 family)